MKDKRKNFQGRILKVYSFKSRPPFFLFLLVSCMTFLISVSILANIYINFKLDFWDKNVRDSITIQVPGVFGKKREYQQNQIFKIKNVIKNNPEISNFSIVSENEANSLLEPWLGKNSIPKDIVIPTIIDIKVRDLAKFDFIQFSRKLNKIGKNIQIIKNNNLIHSGTNTIKTIKIVALSIVFTMLLCVILTVFISCRANVNLHFSSIELLHLIGAKKNYIAKEFVLQNFINGLLTGVIGIIVGCSFILLIGSLYFENFYEDLILSLSLLQNYITIFLLPIFIALLSSLITYFTVINNLKKLP